MNASAAAACLTCLLLAIHVPGQHVNTSGRCKCLRTSSEVISPGQIKKGPFIYSPSLSCPHTEIIITKRHNKEVCVNPTSAMGKFILKNSLRKREAARWTTASSSTAGHRTTGLSSRPYSPAPSGSHDELRKSQRSTRQF